MIAWHRHWILVGILICSSTSFAYDLGGGLGPTPPSRQKITLRASGLLQPESTFDNGVPDSGLMQTSASATVPVYRGESDAVALSARYSWLNFYPDPFQSSDLYDVQFGASFTHQIEEDRLWSIVGTFGSSSDHPFKNSSVCAVGVTAFYILPDGDKSRWLLLLNYSNNRSFLNNVPLPGAAYTYTPSKSFRGTFGFPFTSIYWQFVEDWSITLFGLYPSMAKVQLAYSLMGPMQLFAGADLSIITFREATRTNPKERIYFEEKKAFGGIKSPLNENLSAELESGYSFGREIFTSETYTAEPTNFYELTASWYGKLGMTLSF